MNNGNLALQLVQGTKADRDQYISRVDVLDKLKKIAILPDGKYIKSSDVADYFEVRNDVIRKVKTRHADELKSDGMITLKGAELSKYKEKIQSGHRVTIKANAQITLYTRRSMLRIGMLLTDSPIATKIRDYLLTVEESSTKEQKESALKFTGKWNKEIDQFIVDSMKQTIREGKRVSYAIKDIAEEIGTTANVVHIRWYNGNKELKPLRDRLDKETKEAVSKQLHLKLVAPSTFETSESPVLKNESNNSNEMLTIMNEAFKKQQEILLEVVTELHTVKATNDKLYKGMASIWRGYKELNESHTELKNGLQGLKDELNDYKDIVTETYTEKVKILEKRIDVQKNKLETNKKELQKAKLFIADNIMGDIEESPKQQSFKMDRNGNLTKMN